MIPVAHLCVDSANVMINWAAASDVGKGKAQTRHGGNIWVAGKTVWSQMHGQGQMPWGDYAK
jgi:hypothetical protein